MVPGNGSFCLVWLTIIFKSCSLGLERDKTFSLCVWRNQISKPDVRTPGVMSCFIFLIFSVCHNSFFQNIDLVCQNWESRRKNVNNGSIPVSFGGNLSLCCKAWKAWGSGTSEWYVANIFIISYTLSRWVSSTTGTRKICVFKCRVKVL